MIKFKHTEVLGWEHAIRGMRNPMNSWEKSDSGYGCHLIKGRDQVDWTRYEEGEECRCANCGWCPLLCEDDFDPEYSKHVREFIIGPNDLNLMRQLRNAGTDHRKFMRMIIVYVDITAPLYWWKEFDTYKVGTVANSCSTMHKIAAKEFTLDDFSTEHLLDHCETADGECYPMWILNDTIAALNTAREKYLETKDKKYWWQMIQLLPSSYNQKRTVMMNYEVLANIYKSRENHKLDEWAEHDCTTTSHKDWGDRVYFGFCDWIKTLLYSELITGKEE